MGHARRRRLEPHVRFIGRGSDGHPERLTVSSVASLAQATIGFWPLGAWVPPQRVAAGHHLVRLGANGGPLTNWAGTCHGALLVASGAIDAFFHINAAPWDIAAAVPIVEEAGGRFSDLNGGRSIAERSALYTNGHVHDEVLDALKGVVAGW